MAEIEEFSCIGPDPVVCIVRHFFLQLDTEDLKNSHTVNIYLVLFFVVSILFKYFALSSIITYLNLGLPFLTIKNL